MISKSIKKTLRLSDENWEIIQNKMKESELNFSSFALVSMLNAKVKVKQTKLEREFILELAKWGNNLNQVAKHLNSKKGGVDRVALEMLSEIEEHLKKLKETIE
nr:plasmid mobilization relaxosome protein MobC [Campylobacter armoricus]